MKWYYLLDQKGSKHKKMNEFNFVIKKVIVEKHPFNLIKVSILIQQTKFILKDR